MAKRSSIRECRVDWSLGGSSGKLAAELGEETRVGYQRDLTVVGTPITTRQRAPVAGPPVYAWWRRWFSERNSEKNRSARRLNGPRAAWCLRWPQKRPAHIRQAATTGARMAPRVQVAAVLYWDLDVALKSLGVADAHVEWAMRATLSTRHCQEARNCGMRLEWRLERCKQPRFALGGCCRQANQRQLPDHRSYIRDRRSEALSSAILEYSPGGNKATFLNNRTILTARG